MPLPCHTSKLQHEIPRRQDHLKLPFWIRDRGKSERGGCGECDDESPSASARRGNNIVSDKPVGSACSPTGQDRGEIFKVNGMLLIHNYTCLLEKFTYATSIWAQKDTPLHRIDAFIPKTTSSDTRHKMRLVRFFP